MSINTKIRKKLIEMLRIDQRVRLDQWKKLKKLTKKGLGTESKQYKEEVKKLVKELSTLDKKNTSKIKKITSKYGWPGIALVGKRGERAAWLLVQHATHDLAFQKRCLNILKEAVKKNDADRKHLAYLTDRILVQEKKKQVYGTQFKGRKNGTSEPFPIKNVRKLARLRKSAGLESFSQYKKKMEALNLH